MAHFNTIGHNVFQVVGLEMDRIHRSEPKTDLTTLNYRAMSTMPLAISSMSTTFFTSVFSNSFRFELSTFESNSRRISR